MIKEINSLSNVDWSLFFMIPPICAKTCAKGAKRRCGTCLSSISIFVTNFDSIIAEREANKGNLFFSIGSVQNIVGTDLIGELNWSNYQTSCWLRSVQIFCLFWSGFGCIPECSAPDQYRPIEIFFTGLEPEAGVWRQNQRRLPSPLHCLMGNLFLPLITLCYGLIPLSLPAYSG